MPRQPTGPDSDAEQDCLKGESEILEVLDEADFVRRSSSGVLFRGYRSAGKELGCLLAAECVPQSGAVTQPCLTTCHRLTNSPSQALVELHVRFLNGSKEVDRSIAGASGDPE